MKYKLTQALRDYLLVKGWTKADTSEDDVRAVVEAKIEAGELHWQKLGELLDPKAAVRNIVKDVVNENNPPAPAGTGPSPRKVFGNGSGGTVRRPSERYGVTKTTGRHRTRNHAISNPFTGKDAETSSGSERALFGVYFKFLGRKAGIPARWEEHDSDLLDELIHDHEWCGVANGQFHERIAGGDRIKSILDDSVSGGINLVPVVVDSQIITELLLTSEIYPFVDLTDLTTGRRIEAPVLGTPTVTWGIPEGTALPLFDTTGLLTTVASTVNPVTCALTFGRDLLMNSSVDIGTAIERQIGQKMLTEMDRVILLGDGVVQPLGIFSTPGLTTVASASGGAGPVSMGDLEALYFGLPKQWRTPDKAPSLISNDLNYRRFRGIPTATAYNTRALGTDLASYNIFGLPVRINNTLVNTKMAAVALKAYRLWRRQGWESRWVTEGQTLALKNENLLIVRGLFAGRLTDSAAAVLMTDLAT